MQKTAKNTEKYISYFFRQVLKKLFLLEEELSSEEPRENINATAHTLNRQKQEKEEMINGAEILQEEGQRIIEDVMMVTIIQLFLVYLQGTYLIGNEI